MQIKFNRIYIIESLQSGERRTGTDLHNDLLKWKNVQHPDFESVLKTPTNRDELFSICDEILDKCINENISPIIHFEIHGASVADGPTDRNGDFVINSTIIHCTTMPGALLIEKCKANLRSGCHPVIITIFERVHTALNLAEDAGLAGRVEVWDIQQFLSANVYEHSLFDEAKRNSTLSDIISRYNNIVLETETDPSLRIEFEAR